MFLPNSSQSTAREIVRGVIDQLAGFKVTGRLQTERALPVGTPVTAIGELACVPEALGALPGSVRHEGQVRSSHPLMSQSSLQFNSPAGPVVLGYCGNGSRFCRRCWPCGSRRAAARSSSPPKR